MREAGVIDTSHGVAARRSDRIIITMAARWEPPRTLEEYELVRLLGRGGMGQVWLAQDTLLERPVAIKFIVGERVDANARARFLTEARAIARLDHPNVIRVHRVGELDGRPFLVSEYLQGQSLDRAPRPIELGDAHALALGLARGLAAAHRRGVLHRDVKPANTFLTTDRQLKLLDFGLAKVIDEAEVVEVSAVPALRHVSMAETVDGSTPREASAARQVSMAETVDGATPRELEATLPSDSARGIASSGAPDTRLVVPERDVTLPAPVSQAATPASKSSRNGGFGERRGPSGSTERDASGRRSGRSPAATLAGVLMGTPLYMAPDLWAGQPATMQTDVYALGATLYELITGRPPHEASSLSLLASLTHTREATPVRTLRPEVPAALARVIERCLQRDPARRFASAVDVCAELEAAAREAAAGELPDGNPYRGLSAIDEHHRRLFFGRDREVADILDRLRSEPWLVVAGRSGAGKSSLVRAGVVPRVRDGALDDRGLTGGWRVITMVPGERPLAALATAVAAALDRDGAALEAMLRDDPGQLVRELRADRDHGTLLVIDQLEELVTLGAPDERDRFVDALMPALLLGPRLRVIATIRSDFVGRLDASPGLARALGRALFLLGPLDRDGIRAAVTAPAAAHGFRFESDQDVETLIAAAADHPGGLPLLAFALARLWELRDPATHTIPRRALDAIGGVEGALAQHADDVLALLSPEARGAARTVLLRLVSADRTRARRTATELLGSASDRQVSTAIALEALVNARLVAVEDSDEGPAYELAHESLLNHWPRLRVWLDEEDVDHATRERVELAATDWTRQGRPTDALWTGARLDAVADLRLDELTTPAREFVVFSRSARRRTRRLRSALVVSAFAILSGFLAVTLWLNDRAGKARDRARDSAATARATSAALYQEQGRQALITGDPMRAVAYLVEAFAAGQLGAELRLLLDRATAALDGEVARLVGHEDQVFGLDWTPDGTRLVTSSVDGTLRVWHADEGRAISTMRGHTDRIMEASFSPDGTRVASASFDRTAAIWDANTGERLQQLEGHTHKVFSVDWLADDRVVTASLDGTARIWDVRTGAALATLEHHHKIPFARVDPTGRRIIVGVDNGTAILWDATTHRQLAKLEGHRAKVWRASFSADGRHVVTGSDDKTARVWDVTTGALVATFSEHTNAISHVAVSPDGESVATASEDGTARVWGTTTGETIATLSHGAPVWSVEFSPDGEQLVTASGDGTAALWSARDGTRLWTFVGHLNTVWRAAFSPDGTRIATSSWDWTARVWDGRQSVQRLALAAHENVAWDVALDPSGDRLLTTGDDGDVVLWNLAGTRVPSWPGVPPGVVDQQPRFVRWGPKGDWFVMLRGTAVERRGIGGALLHTYPGDVLPRAAEPSHDGLRLAITDGTDVRVVDAARGEVVQQLRGHTAPVVTVNWNADDGMLLTASEDRTARLWDVATGRTLATLERPAKVVGAWFSPDGRRFAMATADRRLTVWDTASRTLVASCDEETAGVTNARFSPDGELLVSSSIDGAIKVWSASSGRLLSVVGHHVDAAMAVSFHPDGTQIISAGFDGLIRVWRLGAGVGDLARLASDARCRVPYRIERGLLARRAADEPCVQ
jgi:WD40 repeat protein/serine/threonine protein kinase